MRNAQVRAGVVTLIVVILGVGAIAGAANVTLHADRLTATIDGGPSIPVTRQSNNAVQVESLYQTLLALPQVPSYTGGLVLSCQKNTDIVYHLNFYHGPLLVRQIDVQPAGCFFVFIRGDSHPRILTSIYQLTFIQHLVGLPDVPGEPQSSGT